VSRQHKHVIEGSGRQKYALFATHTYAPCV
jgi:hypothetical protein